MVSIMAATTVEILEIVTAAFTFFLIKAEHFVHYLCCVIWSNLFHNFV